MIEWMVFEITFDIGSVMSWWRLTCLCISQVSLILAFGSEVTCRRALPRKPQLFKWRPSPGPLGYEFHRYHFSHAGPLHECMCNDCTETCTNQCIPGVLLTSTPHNTSDLSKPLAAFPNHHFRNNGQWRERNESCRNDYHKSSKRILAEPGIEPAIPCSQVLEALSETGMKHERY